MALHHRLLEGQLRSGQRTPIRQGNRSSALRTVEQLPEFEPSAASLAAELADRRMAAAPPKVMSMVSPERSRQMIPFHAVDAAPGMPPPQTRDRSPPRSAAESRAIAAYARGDCGSSGDDLEPRALPPPQPLLSPPPAHHHPAAMMYQQPSPFDIIAARHAAAAQSPFARTPTGGLPAPLSRSSTLLTSPAPTLKAPSVTAMERILQEVRQRRRSPSPGSSTFRSRSPRFGGLRSTVPSAPPAVDDPGSYVRKPLSATHDFFVPKGMGDTTRNSPRLSPMASRTPRFIPLVPHGSGMVCPILEGSPRRSHS